MTLPSSRPPPNVSHWHGWYDDVLASLRTITPRITDPLAEQWTRGVARAVKYLQQLDVAGRQFVELELDDIAKVTGARNDSLAVARARLDEAVRAGTVSDRDYVKLMWNRVLRDDELMRTASGALHDRTWPPLV